MSFWKRCKAQAWAWGLLTGAVFLGIGAFQGQLSIIWQKAVMICLECIGLG